MNILETLSKKQLNLIEYKDYKSGLTLFYEDDLCKSIGIVLKGQLSIVTYLEDGNEVIYNILKENEIFGNNLIFSSEPYYKGNIITNVDCKIAFISKANLISLLTSNSDFMIEYLRIQSNFGKKLNNTIKLLSIASAQDRFYFYMHENKNRITYTSISELAKRLYIKRETLSRLLSKLEKEKKISKDTKKIILIRR